MTKRIGELPMLTQIPHSLISLLLPQINDSSKGGVNRD